MFETARPLGTWHAKYLTLLDTLRCSWLALWDEERYKLGSFPRYMERSGYFEPR